MVGEGRPDYTTRLTGRSLIFGEDFFCPEHATSSRISLAGLLGKGEAHFTVEGHLEVVDRRGRVLWSAAEPNTSKNGAGRGVSRLLKILWKCIKYKHALRFLVLEGELHHTPYVIRPGRYLVHRLLQLNELAEGKSGGAGWRR